jgi:PEP-CTERM motif
MGLLRFVNGDLVLQLFFNHDFAESFSLIFTPALGVTGTLQGELFATTPGFPVDLGSFSGSVTSTPIPEPRTWAMMLLGFAGLGYAGYRRTRRATVTIA